MNAAARAFLTAVLATTPFVLVAVVAFLHYQH